MAQSASSSSQSSLCFFCGVENGVDVLDPVPVDVRGEVDDFEVEHVQPLSADEDFGLSGENLTSAVIMRRKS